MNAKGPIILVVDDEPSMLLYTRTLLEMEHYTVETVSSGEEAVKRVRSKPLVDLILLDMAMPRMDGLQTIQACQKIRPEQRIVICSCVTDTSKVVQAIKLGALDYMTKPFYKAELDAVVKRTLPREQTETYDVGLGIFDNKLKVVNLKRDDTHQCLDSANNLHNIIYLVSRETLALHTAIEELEALANDPKAREADFHQFFETYPDLVLNEDYKKAHSKVVLANEDGQLLIPDFVLEPLDQNALCDLMELKLPAAQVFVLKKNRPRFSTAIFEARAQLLQYSRFFDDRRNREAVHARYGLLALRPRLFVIIGRLGHVDPLQKRQVEETAPELKVITYDDVINRAKQRENRMKVGGYNLPR